MRSAYLKGYKHSEIIQESAQVICRHFLLLVSVFIFNNRSGLVILIHEKIGNREVEQTKTGNLHEGMTDGELRKVPQNMDLPSQEIRISVRSLVEFILRHGDIDNRYKAAPENAMQEGSRIHRMIQRRMGAEYQAEVSLKYTHVAESCVLVVEGRADGIFRHEGIVTIDEIKGTYRDLSRLTAPARLHIAQARCYAYMYGLGQNLAKVRVRMTYCNMETEELKYFYEEHAFGELEAWFQELISAYRKWADYTCKWREIRQNSIQGLEFPFPYRAGQRELVGNVYKTIYHKKKLFLEAPTGVGKTISTIFPAVQAMGKGMGEKLFYLTARTITRTVAEDTLNLLREKGLRMKSVILTAKEKICFMDETECNPAYCPYAQGHYDRVNDAVFDLITSGESFNREQVEGYARKHRVCPFEMCLDVSMFADAVICDYNYLFDPHVYLKRFFAEGSEGNYIFLVDEAHNLLERGREMYSAVLVKEQFMELRRELKKTLMSETKKIRKKTELSGQMTLDMTLNMTQELILMSEKEVGEETGASQTELQKTVLWDTVVYSEKYDEEIPEEDEPGVSETEMTESNSPGKTSEDSNINEPEAYREDSVAETDAAEADGEGSTEPAFIGHDGKSILVRRGYAEKMIHHLDKCNKELLALKRECEQYRIVETIEPFVQNLTRLHTAMEDYLAEQEESRPDVFETLLDFYFEICHFLLIYELLDENYVKYTRTGDDGSFSVKLFCVNPRENLKNCMLRGRSTILFSATFLPIQYYKKLLGGDGEDYEVYAQSVFHPARRALLIAQDVTSRYARRSEEEYSKIARYIEEIVKNRHGNYMVFCPSHAFMRIIYERYVDNFGGEERVCIVQGESMSEEEREAFLAHFREPYTRTEMGQDVSTAMGQDVSAVMGQDVSTAMGQDVSAVMGQNVSAVMGQDISAVMDKELRQGTDRELRHGQSLGIAQKQDSGADQWGEDRILIGFCVLGGIFSEGIDLKNDSLIGAIIVGTGLPQISGEKEILKGYFNGNGEDGFDYAFRYPGMNKVLQAAGRVIRTVEDVGIIALLDERFLQYSYRRLFPREWENFETVSVNTVAKRVERFWDEWL